VEAAPDVRPYGRSMGGACDSDGDVRGGGGSSGL
jgi:hypothetical protein